MILIASSAYLIGARGQFHSNPRSRPPQRHSPIFRHDRIARPLHRKRLTPPHRLAGDGDHAQPRSFEIRSA